jgi:hypothetical protein
MSEAAKYSEEWLRNHVAENGYNRLTTHPCSLCGVNVGWLFGEEAEPHEVVHQSACGCVITPHRPTSFTEIAEAFAMQSSDEIRERMLAGFRKPQEIAA